MKLFRRRPSDPFIHAMEESLVALDAGVVRWIAEERHFAVGTSIVSTANLRAGWDDLAPGKREAWLDGAVRALFTSAVPERLGPGDQNHLMVGVRSRAMLESLRLRSLAADPQSLPNEAIITVTEDLAAMLIWDTPTTMAAIDSDHLAAWGLGRSEAVAIALDNLRSCDFAGWEAMESRPGVSGAGHVFRSVDGDDHLCGRLLLPDLLDGLPFRDEVVAIVPDRTTLYLAAADDDHGIALAMELALQDADRPGAVSLTPIVGRPGSWERLEMGRHERGHRTWRELTRTDAVLDSALTLDVLRSLMEPEGVFVPEVLMAEGPDGSAVTAAVWMPEPTLLPQTDLVVFSELDGAGWKQQAVPWAVVSGSVPHLLEPTGHHPRRFRTNGFPSDVELATMEHQAAAG